MFRGVGGTHCKRCSSYSWMAMIEPFNRRFGIREATESRLFDTRPTVRPRERVSTLFLSGSPERNTMSRLRQNFAVHCTKRARSINPSTTGSTKAARTDFGWHAHATKVGDRRSPACACFPLPAMTRFRNPTTSFCCGSTRCRRTAGRAGVPRTNGTTAALTSCGAAIGSRRQSTRAAPLPSRRSIRR